MLRGFDSRWVTRRMASGGIGLSARRGACVTGLLGVVLGLTVGCAPYDLEGPAAPSVSILDYTAEGGVVLLASARLAEPAEVIGILDLHLPHGEHELGLEQLALAAAELGADAVVGVELTHGDGEGPMHLSGLAVRVLR